MEHLQESNATLPRADDRDFTWISPHCAGPWVKCETGFTPAMGLRLGPALARAYRGGLLTSPDSMVGQRRREPRLQASQFALFHGPRHGRA